MDFIDLYITFFRIGILTFGGGLTMLPLLKYELCETKKWITEEKLLDCYAIGQCTPGIIAVNTATYVGYLKRGILGGIFATLGMISPSVIIITLIAMFLQNFMEVAIIQHALMGIRGAVCALMLNTVYSLAKKSLISIVNVVICAITLLLALFTDVPTIVLIIAAGVCGVIIEKIRGGKKNEQ
ncbi:MAG: chromate transporter [Lachnospiraceae bacterium]|nr:chromate transporter [Lachnospiraceae bacterium]